MSTDIDLDAADSRTHRVRVLTIISNRVLVVLLAFVGAVAWRCDPDARTRRSVAKSEANGDAEFWEGKARECVRWTQ